MIWYNIKEWHLRLHLFMCLRFILQRYSPRIYWIIWRKNEAQVLKVLNKHQKTRFVLIDLLLPKGGGFLLKCSTRKPIKVVWCMRKDVCHTLISSGDYNLMIYNHWLTASRCLAPFVAKYVKSRDVPKIKRKQAYAIRENSVMWWKSTGGVFRNPWVFVTSLKAKKE